MSETRWTPGPWEWAWGDAGHEYSDPYCDVFVDGGNLIIASVNDLFSKEEGHANAHLIAASPDLYEVLHAMTHGLYDKEKEITDKALAVLAKARGETNE